MTAKIRIDGFPDADIIKGSVNETLNSIATFDVEVLAQDLVDWKNAFNQPCQVLVDGHVILDGVLHKRPAYRRSKNEVLSVKLQGRSLLHELSCIPAGNSVDFHFQDQLVQDILNTLFAFAPNWVINYVNFPDPTVQTTIDLRSKESLLGQITAVVESVPEIFYRFGSVDAVTGIRTFEVGNFDALAVRWESDNDNTRIELSFNSAECIDHIVASGELSSTEIVTLVDAIADPRTAASQYWLDGFEIDTADTGSQAVFNRNQPCNCGRNKKYPLTKTANDEVATEQERIESGYALYLKTVRDLLQFVIAEVYKTTVYRHYDSRPTIGDFIELRGDLHEPVNQQWAGIFKKDYVVVEQLSGQFRINSIKTDLTSGLTGDPLGKSQGNVIRWDVTATNNPDALVGQLDKLIELYEKLEDTTANDNPAAVNPVFTPALVSVTHNDALDPSDCNITGTDGKLYTFTAPPTPTGATSATVYYTINSPLTELAVVQAGDLTTDLILCLGNSNDPMNQWGFEVPDRDLTANAIWFFNQ